MEDLIPHESEEAVAVLDRRHAADGVLVIDYALPKVFEHLLLSKACKYVNNSHEVDARAVLGNQSTFLRLKKRPIGSPSFMWQYFVFAHL